MEHLLQRIVQAKSSVLAIVQTIVANVGIQCANIAAGVIAARTLGPAGRGSLTAITMWPQFLAYALTLGVPLASVYSIRKQPEQASSRAGAALLLSLLLGILASLVGFVVIPHSLHTYPLQTVHAARIAVSVAPLALLGITLAVQAQSAGSFKHYNFFRFLPPMSVLAVLGAERLTHCLTVRTAAAAYLLAGIPSMLWNLAWVLKRFSPKFLAPWSATRTLLAYGLRAWGADLLGMVANQVDRLLVVALLSPGAMGLYVVAQSAAGVLNAVPAAVVPVTLPRAAGASHKEIVALAGRTVRMTLFVMVAAATPLFLGGTLLLHIFYGSKFDAASLVLRILIVETILDGLTSVLSQAFLAAGYPGTVTFLQACGVLSAVPLLYLLIPRWGVAGAAVALTASTAIRFTFILLNFPYRLKMSPPGLLINKSELLAVFKSSLASRSTQA